MSENKTGKYFKYAIGEIVLVMIGILLALQVSNWNDRNNKNKLKQEYINSLINDYTQDTIQLNRRLNRNRKRNTYIEGIVDSIANGLYSSLDDYIDVSNRSTTSIRVKNTYNNNSFNLLIAGGQIDLFKQEVRKELMELNRLQIQEREVQQGNSRLLLDFLKEISIKYPPMDITSVKDMDSHMLFKNINLDALPRDIFTFLSQEFYTNIRYIEMTEGVLKQTETVLELLYKYND